MTAITIKHAFIMLESMTALGRFNEGEPKTPMQN